MKKSHLIKCYQAACSFHKARRHWCWKPQGTVVAQGPLDREKPLTIHTKMTSQRSSLRIILSFASITVYELWTQDVHQTNLLLGEKYSVPYKNFPPKQLQVTKSILPKGEKH